MRAIDEVKDKELLKGLMEEARKQTIETLPVFLTKLTTEYKHDYGTICHASAIAAVAGASAINHSPHGGITGFQAGAVMWEFVHAWMHLEGPLRLCEYRNLLYPQYCDGRFNEIDEETFKYLQEEAKERLKQHGDASGVVIEHWKALAAGKNVTGMKIKKESGE